MTTHHRCVITTLFCQSDDQLERSPQHSRGSLWNQ